MQMQIQAIKVAKVAQRRRVKGEKPLGIAKCK